MLLADLGFPALCLVGFNLEARVSLLCSSGDGMVYIRHCPASNGRRATEEYTSLEMRYNLQEQYSRRSVQYL